MGDEICNNRLWHRRKNLDFDPKDEKKQINKNFMRNFYFLRQLRDTSDDQKLH